jgi:hypothetical protein
MLHMAVAYYEESLAVAEAAGAAEALEGLTVGGGAGGAGAGGDGRRSAEAVGTLVREAAHNLAHIYSSNGAEEMARQVLRRYVVV